MTGPPETPTRVEMAAAIRDAVTAARAGRPLSACPYTPTAGRHADRLTRIWVRAYLRTRPAVADALTGQPITSGPGVG